MVRALKVPLSFPTAFPAARGRAAAGGMQHGLEGVRFPRRSRLAPVFRAEKRCGNNDRREFGNQGNHAGGMGVRARARVFIPSFIHIHKKGEKHSLQSLKEAA